MKEIKCPHCGKVFTVDEDGYAAIVSQVKTEEFEKELHRRVKEIEDKHKAELDTAKVKAESMNDKEVAELNNQINLLKAQLETNDKDKVIAVKEALEKQNELINKRDREIEALNAKLSSTNENMKLTIENEVNKAVSTQKDIISKKEKEIVELNSKITTAQKDSILAQEKIKQELNMQIQLKDGEIAQLKDYKSKLSVKLVGEDLEQHCQNEFNKNRMMGFQTAYFEKDNDAKTGSKGDYIFKDYLDDVEYISIMFEMKNESDTSVTKHKNEHFFKELDKDRNEKGCEYAVLVSMLEPESELYNQGIVDVSYQYPKMFVIRPQFFMPLISLLRNAAMNNAKAKKELIEVKNANIDITHFEDKMNDFKEKFGKHYETAQTRFQEAITNIDKTITDLTKVKEKLMASEKQLRLANDDTESLTIKKLTRGNPTMKAMFDELQASKDKD